MFSIFLETFEAALSSANDTLSKVRIMNDLWKKIELTNLNARQEKVMKKLLEAEPQGYQGGLTNKKYVAITKTSTETAKRDLANLVGLQMLIMTSTTIWPA